MTIAWPSLNSSAPKESPVARLPSFCRHRRCLVPLTGLRWKNMRRLVINCSEHEPRLAGENWYSQREDDVADIGDGDRTEKPQLAKAWVPFGVSLLFATHARSARNSLDQGRAGFRTCRHACSTSTLSGCSSILAINKTSHCFSSATSKV